MSSTKSNRKKIGKNFEEDIKKSTPTECYINKYADSSVQYKKVHNPSDFELMGNAKLMLLECKTTQDSSFSFNNITPEQLYKMCLIVANKKNVVGGYLINFRKVETTYYIPVECLLEFISQTNRKSIPREVLQEKGVVVPSIKKRTRYRYDMQFLIDYIEERSKLYDTWRSA